MGHQGLSWFGKEGFPSLKTMFNNNIAIIKTQFQIIISQFLLLISWQLRPYADQIIFLTAKAVLETAFTTPPPHPPHPNFRVCLFLNLAFFEI